MDEMIRKKKKKKKRRKKKKQKLQQHPDERGTMSALNDGPAAAAVAAAAAADTALGGSALAQLPLSTAQVLLVLAPAVILSAAFRLGDLAECLLGSSSGNGNGNGNGNGRTPFVRTLVDACTRLALVLAAAFVAEYAPVYEHEVRVCVAAPSCWFGQSASRLLHRGAFRSAVNVRAAGQGTQPGYVLVLLHCGFGCCLGIHEAARAPIARDSALS